jgi:hypothetical protein
MRTNTLTLFDFHLLTTKSEQRHDFARQSLGRLKALRVQHHLADLTIAGNFVTQKWQSQHRYDGQQ